MYSRATASELRTAKLRLLRDILRPLRRGAYLKQLFLNLDLIQKEVAELQGVALEADLFAALPDARVRALTGALLREYEKMQQPGLRRDEAQAIVFETLSRQLEIVGDLLASSRLDDEVIELLRELFEKKAVAFELLPSSLQNDIRTDRWTANYLRDPDMFISGFDAIESSAAYISQVPYVVGIIPNLCRVKRFEDAARVVAVLERHRTTQGGFSEREALVNDAMKRLSGGATIELLTEAMLNEPKEVRAILRRLLAVMGKRAVPPLIRVLEQSDREDVRSDCALTLIAIGEPIRELIELRLLSRHLSGETSVYLLKVLAELADERSTDVFVAHTRHRESSVRNIALRSLVRMHGSRANNVVARATTDTSAKVAQRAIRLLADQESKHPAYLYVILQILGLAPISQAEQREITVKLQVTAVEALGTLSLQSDLGALGKVEDLLLQCVDTGESAMVNFFQRGKTDEHDEVRVTVCRLLGDKGTEASLKRLSQFAREPSPLVRTQMQQAAEKIQRRLSSSA
jgi:HEAT repeat protein